MLSEEEFIARICHEVNRAYCASLGDYSQPAWENAPDWQKQSAINGVKFHLANPDAGPEGSHENWLNEKAADGWTYGEVKDPEAKTHPCFRPYSELPQEQRSKDFIFTAVVWALHKDDAPSESTVEATLVRGSNLLGLPVAGYRAQSETTVAMVNKNKVAEETILRSLDELANDPEVDKRWLAIGRTHIEQGFMAINRSIFKPTRLEL